MKSIIKMATKSVISEHKRLTNVLRHPTKTNLAKELKIQEKELSEYQNK